jgi:hypothetical protein
VKIDIGEFYEIPDLVKIEQKFRKLYMKTKIGFLVASEISSPESAFFE